jgi:predicted permease
MPVRLVMQADPYQIIRSGSMVGNGGQRFTMRDLLLAVQIAICAVLVTSSLVAVRGLVRSLHSTFGFLPNNAMLVDTHLSMVGYNGESAAAMQRRMLDTASAIPGVTVAGITDRIPLGLNWNSALVFADSTTDYRTSNAAADAWDMSVSPNYFEAAGTALLAGRTFTWHDDGKAPAAAVVNREFARKIFGSIEKAIGGHYKIGQGKQIEVVGVVEDGKYRTLTEDPRAAMFLPILQQPDTDTVLVLRSSRDPQELTAALEQMMQALDPALPFTLRTWNRELDWPLFAPRIATIALGVLGILGAMLAVTGIFGMAAYVVSKRMREFGIRVALGARKKEVIVAALGHVFRLLVVGSAAGLMIGVFATKLLSYVVYEATPGDPAVLCGVVAMMLLIGLAAAWIPAKRALAVDPVILLRQE